jgi:uncharacterized protein (TIGR02594 family)
MKKLKTLACATMAIFATAVVMPSMANARPTTETHNVQKAEDSKKVVKKKKKNLKKSKKRFVETVNQPTIDQLRGECYSKAGDSAAAFFSCDEIGKSTFKVANVEPTKKVVVDDKPLFSFFSSNTPKKTIISEASKLEGLHARKDREVIKKYLKASKSNQEPVDPTQIPWCAAFANAVLRRTGFEGTESHMARSFLNWGQKTTKPEEGDIVVLKRGRSSATGHVGFFSGYEWYGSQQYVKVLGGNQNKSVNIAYYPVNYVLGYRRPV